MDLKMYTERVLVVGVNQVTEETRDRIDNHDYGHNVVALGNDSAYLWVNADPDDDSCDMPT